MISLIYLQAFRGARSDRGRSAQLRAAEVWGRERESVSRKSWFVLEAPRRRNDATLCSVPSPVSKGVLSDCSCILFLALTSVDTVLGRHLGVSTLLVFVFDLLFQTSWCLRVRRAVHVCEDFSSWWIFCLILSCLIRVTRPWGVTGVCNIFSVFEIYFSFVSSCITTPYGTTCSRFSLICIW